MCVCLCVCVCVCLSVCIQGLWSLPSRAFIAAESEVKLSAARCSEPEIEDPAQMSDKVSYIGKGYAPNCEFAANVSSDFEELSFSGCHEFRLFYRCLENLEQRESKIFIKRALIESLQ
jgi:hypothetical protein